MTKRGSSKIMPNNGNLARLARGGDVVSRIVRPRESRRGFKPWSAEQPEYEAWFKERMRGQLCQCPDATCNRTGNRLHHEEYGRGFKDGRTIVWLSEYCHVEVRHPNTGCAGWTAVQYAAGCRARAHDNWIAYCDFMERAA